MGIENWLSDHQRVFLNVEVFDWQNVINGVSLESVLGFTLYLIHVSKAATFDDDIKLGGKEKCSEDCDKI